MIVQVLSLYKENKQIMSKLKWLSMLTYKNQALIALKELSNKLLKTSLKLMLELATLDGLLVDKK